MKILVTGGTGVVGSKVIEELLKRNAEVRALVRSEGGSGKLPKAVEALQGDLMDPVSVEKALHGVDKLYLLNAVAADELTQGLIAFGLARKMKVKQVVYHSVFKAERFKDVPHFASKLAIENALREFDVPFTIIRPGYFYQNDLALKDAILKAGVYPMPLGTAGVSAVDVRDIAEAAAIALTGKGHEGNTYNLIGPEDLSGPGAASIWSSVVGREVKYGGENMDTFEAQMRQMLPSWAAFDLRIMFQSFLERGFGAAEGDLETLTKLLGHSPRTYQDFAREAASMWRA